MCSGLEWNSSRNWEGLERQGFTYCVYAVVLHYMCVFVLPEPSVSLIITKPRVTLYHHSAVQRIRKFKNKMSIYVERVIFVQVSCLIVVTPSLFKFD